MRRSRLLLHAEWFDAAGKADCLGEVKTSLTYPQSRLPHVKTLAFFGSI